MIWCNILVVISPVVKSLDEWGCRCCCCCWCWGDCCCFSNSGRPNGRLGNASRMVSFPLIVAELRRLDTITVESVSESFASPTERCRIDLLRQYNFFGNEIVWINYIHSLLVVVANPLPHCRSNENVLAHVVRRCLFRLLLKHAESPTEPQRSIGFRFFFFRLNLRQYAHAYARWIHTQSNRIQQINPEQRIISFVKQLVSSVRAVERYLR